MTNNTKTESSFSSALFYSFFGKYLNIALQLGASVVLARIIPPEDYGLFAVALIFSGTAGIIKEFGVNNYLVKEKTLTTEIIRSAYGTSLVIASLVAMCLFFLSYPIAHFYQQDELITILQLLSVNIVLSPFGSIIDCLLRREMHFKPALIAGVVSQLISVASMIILAMQGFGVYALVWGSLIQTISLALVFQFFRPVNMPLLPSLKKSGRILSYSKFVGISGIVGYFSNQFTVLLSGKYFSLETTGLLTRASSTASLFSKLFTEAFNPVLMPYISLLNRRGGDFVAKLQFLLKMSLSLSWPFYVILGLCAEPVVLVLFGENWLTSAYFLKIICVSLIVVSTVQLLDPVLMGLGMAKPLMKITLILSMTRVAICIFMVQYGLMAMMMATAMILPILRFTLFMIVMNRKKVFSPKEYLRWLKEPAILLIASSFPLVAINLYFGHDWWQHYVPAVLALASSVIIWVAVLVMQGNAKPIFDLVRKKLTDKKS